MNKAGFRFGVFGMGRGAWLLPCILAAGGEVVAICERRAAGIARGKQICPDAAVYTDFDEFLKHDMDAVLLCNDFCEHAPYAIKVMRAGKHCLSETLSNITMAQGVELCRVKEETGVMYALLENCPFFKQAMEMTRICESGALGSIVYGEGEYAHPMSEREHNNLANGEYHWRNWTPRTYYTTHSLAPLMRMTDSMPKRVTAFASHQPEVAHGTANQNGDAAAVILVSTDKNAVFRIIGWAGYAVHGLFYRLNGLKGCVDTDHATGRMRLSYNPWTTPEGEESKQEYAAAWPDAELGKIADQSGHDGADFWMMVDLIDCMKKGIEPYFNVYRATALSSVAILSWRSVLNGGMPFEIPDFSKEEERKKWENDRVSPFPNDKGEAAIPCSSMPYKPTVADVENAKRYWEQAVREGKW